MRTIGADKLIPHQVWLSFHGSFLPFFVLPFNLQSNYGGPKRERYSPDAVAIRRRATISQSSLVSDEVVCANVTEPNTSPSINVEKSIRPNRWWAACLICFTPQFRTNSSSLKATKLKFVVHACNHSLTLKSALM